MSPNSVLPARAPDVTPFGKFRQIINLVLSCVGRIKMHIEFSKPQGKKKSNYISTCKWALHVRAMDPRNTLCDKAFLTKRRSPENLGNSKSDADMQTVLIHFLW